MKFYRATTDIKDATSGTFLALKGTLFLLNQLPSTFGDRLEEVKIISNSPLCVVGVEVQAGQEKKDG